MNFKHVYLFLMLSRTFYWKIYFQTLKMSVRETALGLGQLLRSAHMEKSYLGKAVPGCWTAGNPPLEVAPGQRKTHVNSCRRQTVHRGKVDPGVSELPRGNELFRDHVNWPLVEGQVITFLKVWSKENPNQGIILKFRRRFKIYSGIGVACQGACVHVFS